jgi:hypothetical protein
MNNTIDIEHDSIEPVLHSGDWIFDPDSDRVGIVEDSVALAEDGRWLVAYRDLAGRAHTVDGWPTKLRGGVTPWGDDRRITPNTLAWALASAERLGFTHVVGQNDDLMPIAEGISRALSGDASWVAGSLSDDDTFTLYASDGFVFSDKHDFCACVLETLGPSRWERLRQPWLTAPTRRGTSSTSVDDPCAQARVKGSEPPV